MHSKHHKNFTCTANYSICVLFAVRMCECVVSVSCVREIIFCSCLFIKTSRVNYPI